MGLTVNPPGAKIIGLVTEVKRFSLHDGPGIRTTVFVKGCPLRCKWCSNPETWSPHPEIYFIAKRCANCGACARACPTPGAISMAHSSRIDRGRCARCMKCVEACPNGALRKVGDYVTPEEVAEEVMKDYVFYVSSNGGVTVSGGEPLYQPGFTSELLRICREEGVHTCLDTSGYAEPSVVEEVLRHVDLVLLDIKHMDPVEHKRWTGVSNDLIIKNAELMVRRCEVRISIPLVPRVNIDSENLRRVAEFAASLGVKFIDLLPIHRLGESKYEYLGLRPPFHEFEEVPLEEVGKIRRLFESYGFKTTVGRGVL
ncbi:MAG: glycyl-radical enzyme activating protein [Candidatus Nezhaarchaeota archaeon]|nr:glycyl-radical enzyme activating protein [Candidatus Nezhaarchaeota archaeon]